MKIWELHKGSRKACKQITLKEKGAITTKAPLSYHNW